MSETAFVTVLFCDLVASTERRTRTGDDEADTFRRQFFEALRNAVAATDGLEVSNTGDGLMVVFRESVRGAVDCAVRIHQAVESIDPQNPALMRVGLSAGEVAHDGVDWFGTPVVQAARLCAVAQPRHTLATEVVANLVGSRGNYTFRPVGTLELKGLVPVSTVALAREGVTGPPTRIASAPSSADGVRRRFLGRLPMALALGALVPIVAVVVLATRATNHDRGGVPSPVGYRPKYLPTACPQDTRTKVGHASCGWLIVPQNREQPKGQQVRLLIQRIPPLQPTATAAPPTLDLCGCDPIDTSPVREHSELILVPQRGIDPNSTPQLTCPEVTAAVQTSLTLPSTDPSGRAAILDASRRCRSRLLASGLDPADYNYDSQAQDVLDLMSVLGIGRADIVASYGYSHVVFGILHKAPNILRSFTAAQPEPAGLSIDTDPSSYLANAWDRFIAQCKASPNCAASFPDLASDYRVAHSRIADAPPLVQASTQAGGAVKLLFDGDRIGLALNQALSDSSTYPLIPAALRSPSPNLAADEAVAGGLPLGTQPWGAIFGFLCSYDAYTISQGASLSASTLPDFAGPYDLSPDKYCSAWNVPKLPDYYFNDVASAVPSLIVVGELAPGGGVAWTQQMQHALPNATVVSFATLGAFGLLELPPPCFDGLRRQFLASPSTHLNSRICSSQSPPIDFTTNP
jgi:class 3 adenylate cyclase